MADDDGPTGCFLGSRLGWDALEVRRWNGRARLGELYLHRIDVMPYRGGAPCDSTDLLGESATLLMPGREPMRVHGVVTQVMEGAAPGGGDRLVLEPLLALLRRRHHHRHFVDRPLRDVVREVLDHDGPGALRPVERDAETVAIGDEGRGSYSPPLAGYRWDVESAERLMRPLPYRVQQGESDLTFFTRLLAEAGLTYLFEHQRHRSVLVITDAPALAYGGLPLVRPLAWDAPPSQEEAVHHFRPLRRLSDLGGTDDSLSEGRGPLRGVEPGRPLHLTDPAGFMGTLELYAVTSEIRVSVGGVDARFEALPIDAPPPPLASSPSPRAPGVSRARITEVASASEVRVAFAWDQQRRFDRPSSPLVPVVAQALPLSRGDEVVVAFLDGEPERPIVVARLGEGAGSHHPPASSTLRPPPESDVPTRTAKPREGARNDPQAGARRATNEDSLDTTTALTGPVFVEGELEGDRDPLARTTPLRAKLDVTTTLKAYPIEALWPEGDDG